MGNLRPIKNVNDLTKGTLVLDTETKALYRIQRLKRPDSWALSKRYWELIVTYLADNKDYRLLEEDNKLLTTLKDCVIVEDDLIIKTLYGLE